MGLQDRDYYRQDYAKKVGLRYDTATGRYSTAASPGLVQASPAANSKTKTAFGLLTVLVALVAFVFFPEKQNRENRPPTPQQPASTKVQQPVNTSIKAKPSKAHIYRCGDEYTDIPCANGIQVDASPALTDPAGPATTVINLCQAPGGGQYWTAQACSSRSWTLIRTARVPVQVPWADQVAAGRTQHQAAQQLTTTPSIRYGVAASRKDECARLEARVAELDRMGRVGGTAAHMDWLRHERKAARDKQFRIRC